MSAKLRVVRGVSVECTRMVSMLRMASDRAASDPDWVAAALNES